MNSYNQMEDLIQKLKIEIIEALNLQDYSPADIDSDAPLFGSGLGLDSIDSLELMVLLERNYGIKIEDPRKGREVLESVRSMAQFIQSQESEA
ncbi:MAG: phosphopantetheine-binding protein [Saprospiraceae bacterium]|jgi:acyl carrier protein|nr:acyl carrier protein [Saprospiraceae bacterium]MBP9124742.1 acyl carrier protein [Saprospiraceae bacterium]MBP9846974.1 acyl carrier protein [Saprospiraceae bacterium]HQW70792.1 phosphopantetheine-binding protein [Saprospiraceae bacterium]